MMNSRLIKACWALSGPFLLLSAAHAQSVVLSGLMGSKALLVIDGSAPKAVGLNEQFKGVRVVQIHKDSALIEIQGQRQNLRLGEPPINVGPGLGNGERKVVLFADGGGHFRTSGLINNKPAQYMIDTGASVVGIGKPDAQRLGLPYEQGEPVMMNTANGQVQGWKIRLDSVRIGELQSYGVEAVVTPQPMPYILLGNSFLSTVQMTRRGHEMVLEQR